MAYHDPTDPSTDADSHRLGCPQCGKALIRIQRRPIDRLFSLFSPLQRFRCRNHDCQWQGNIKIPRLPSDDSRPSAER